MSAPHAESRIHRFEQERGPRFALVCMLIILLICLLMTLPETPGGRLITTTLAGLVMLTTVWAANARGRVMHVAAVVVVVAVLASAASLIVLGDRFTTPDEVVMTVFTLAMPVAILRGLRNERTVNIQTVFGAISFYFMIGLFFAFLISIVARSTNQDYFAQHTNGDYSQKIYFSFVTLATLGYGDLTPATAVGRLLAVFETVIGSLYLVTAVSLVVSRLGASRDQHSADERAPG